MKLYIAHMKHTVIKAFTSARSLNEYSIVNQNFISYLPGLPVVSCTLNYREIFDKYTCRQTVMYKMTKSPAALHPAGPRAADKVLDGKEERGRMGATE